MPAKRKVVPDTSSPEPPSRTLAPPGRVIPDSDPAGIISLDEDDDVDEVIPELDAPIPVPSDAPDAVPSSSPPPSSSPYHPSAASSVALVAPPIDPATILEAGDAHADWILAEANITGPQLDFSLLGPSDYLRRATFQKLTAPERALWYELFSLLKAYIARLRLASWNHPSKKWVWTWPIWARILDTLAARIRAPGSNRDCMLAHTASGPSRLFFGLDNSGYPKINIRPGTIMRRTGTGNRKYDSGAWDYFITHKSCDTSAGRVMAVLGTQRLPLRGEQASHLCYRVPSICLRPSHFVWEQDVDNKRRNFFVAGIAAFDPSTPRGIYTSAEGVYLPCRNDEHWVSLSCRPGCTLRCMEYRLSPDCSGLELPRGA